MILIPSHNEVKIEYVDDSFLITQTDEMRQIEDVISIESLANMKGFIASLQRFVSDLENDTSTNGGRTSE